MFLVYNRFGGQPPTAGRVAASEKQRSPSIYSRRLLKLDSSGLYTRARMSATKPTVGKAVECLKLGLVQAAVEMLERICAKEPKNADAAHLYGLALFQLGEGERAARELERAVRLRPRAPATHIALGNVLTMQQQHARAVASFRQAIRLDVGAGPAYVGLALALTRLHDYSGAIAAAREALRLMPENFQPHANLASALREAGEVEAAIATLEEARRRFPDNREILSLLLAARNYSSDSDPVQCTAEARAFGALVGPPEPVDWRQAPEPQRRLRVGYLSADLRTHSVSYFLEPILAHHDAQQFEVSLYALSPRCDTTTERLRASAAHWCDVSRLDGQALVARLREDRVDILVELGGHTGGNRLAALAAGAAPIQVTYLGYPNTTGVPAIGYRLVDAISDPPGAERYATEQLVRLPECFLCYGPPADAPQPHPPPCQNTGYVTFGSFNSLPKIGPPVVETWARVLERVNGSRLFLKNRSLADPSVAQAATSWFSQRGIAPDRLRLVGQTPTPAGHLALYADVDIAFDSFPYNGTTTTCEALWMGVPVVVLQGREHAARVGMSLLNAAGLCEHIAETPDGYVNLAVQLANDRPRLAQLRRELRAHVAASPLCDAAGFTRRLEDAYRPLWREWCAARRG